MKRRDTRRASIPMKSAGARPSQPRGEKTRRRLLASALDLLAAAGPGAVTHRAVSEQAGVSLGAATYYFPSKYDLLSEVYRLHLTSVRERAESILEALPENRGDFAEGVTRYLEQGVRNDRLASLATFELTLERARNPTLRRRLRGLQSESDAFAARILRDEGISDPEDAATLLIAAISGLRLEWLAEGTRSEFSERIPQLVVRLCRMLRLGGEVDSR